MSSQKLVKKGSVAHDKGGDLFLVNEENEAYRVDETVIFIWSRCEGKTAEELTSDIATSTEKETSELKEPVERVVSRLKEAKLVA